MWVDGVSVVGFVSAAFVLHVPTINDVTMINVCIVLVVVGLDFFLDGFRCGLDIYKHREFNGSQHSK